MLTCHHVELQKYSGKNVPPKKRGEMCKLSNEEATISFNKVN